MGGQVGKRTLPKRAHKAKKQAPAKKKARKAAGRRPEAARRRRVLAILKKVGEREPAPTAATTAAAGAGALETLAAAETAPHIPRVVTPDDEAHLALVKRGRAVADRVRAGKTQLTAREVFAAEALLVATTRPVLFIENGRFELAAPEYEAQRTAIERAIPAVGKVLLDNVGTVGTAFLAAPDVIVTARHVAAELFRADGTPRAPSRIDFLGERGGSATIERQIIAEVHRDTRDFALLRLGAAMSITPLVCAAQQPALGTASLYIVGYPLRDKNNELTPDELAAIIRGFPGTKRLQPGVCGSAIGAPLFGHDCSTLSGNSGSPVIDLGTGRVVGVHSDGSFQSGGESVALWNLTNRPTIQGFGVTFA